MTTAASTGTGANQDLVATFTSLDSDHTPVLCRQLGAAPHHEPEQP